MFYDALFLASKSVADGLFGIAPDQIAALGRDDSCSQPTFRLVLTYTQFPVFLYSIMHPFPFNFAMIGYGCAFVGKF